VLAHEIYNTPPAIALLYVGHRKRRRFEPAQRAAEEYGDDGAVAQADQFRSVRRVQERLSLLSIQPIPGADPEGFGALHALDAGGQFGRQQAVVHGLHRKFADRGHADDDT
jgi:hypothetical protein